MYHHTRKIVSVTDWTALKPNDRVIIRYEGGKEQIAFVDEISPSGDIVWIKSVSLAERKLVHASDCLELAFFHDEVPLPQADRLSRGPQASQSEQASSLPEAIKHDAGGTRRNAGRGVRAAAFLGPLTNESGLRSLSQLVRTGLDERRRPPSPLIDDQSTRSPQLKPS